MKIVTTYTSNAERGQLARASTGRRRRGIPKMRNDFQYRDVVEVDYGYKWGSIGTIVEISEGGDLARLEFSTNDHRHWFHVTALRLRCRPVELRHAV